MTIRIQCPFSEWATAYSRTLQINEKVKQQPYHISIQYSKTVCLCNFYMTAIYIPKGSTVNILMNSNMKYKNLGTFNNNVKYSLDEALLDYHQISEYPNVLNDGSTIVCSDYTDEIIYIHKPENTQSNIFINGLEYERMSHFFHFSLVRSWKLQ